MKFFYYLFNFLYNFLPSIYFKWKYHHLHNKSILWDQDYILNRINYYCKINGNFHLPSDIPSIKYFKKTRGTGYYLDLKEFLHFFVPATRIAYHFGDETHINDYPTLFKARPLNETNQNSVLFKLNKRRHFKFIKDNKVFKDKKDQLVWRGAAYQTNRKSFVQKFWNHPMFDVGQTNKPIEDIPWQKDFMTIKEQLDYKFIFCGEGNDVATNLKWAMSSNSLCMMPKPTCETWFMEGTLISNYHYVEVKPDFSDMVEKMKFYIQNQDEALQIIQNANNFVHQFTDKDREDFLCIKVLEKYVYLSQQRNAIRYAKK